MFIHSETGDHPDHRVTNQAARDGRSPTSVPLVSTQFSPGEIPTTFVMDTFEGRHSESEVFIDISTVITSTENMLAVRENQTAWLQQTYETNIANDLLVQARFGGPAGRKNAEDFRLLHDWLHTGDWSVLP
jgi:LmbE family N-acetylglucosaminyl deacetylase